MIGILVMTHGELGAQIIETARLIGLNSEKSLAAMDMTAGANPHELQPELMKAIARLSGIDSDDSVAAVGIPDGASPDSLKRDLQKAIKDVDAGEGVLILTDLFGGTPTNLSLSFLQENKVEVVTGVNLPMVVRAINCRQERDLDSLSKMVSETGRESIYLAGELLREKLSPKSDTSKKSPRECG